MHPLQRTRPKILFTNPSDPSGEYQKEKETASLYFPVVTSRMNIPHNSLVIGRYSVLPMYKQLEEDLECVSSKLINSYREHRYIADLKNWYQDLEKYTFPTWFRMEDVPEDCGPVVLKGETNSRKDRWNTHMFAKDKKEALEIFFKLQVDSCIGNQDICIRKYVPLVTLLEDPYGPPVTLEYRFFCAYGRILSGAYYWSSSIDDVKDHPLLKSDKTLLEASGFVGKILPLISQHCNFVVVDVAKGKDGKWYVVELNDGQMSGLSENQPDILYENLRAVVDNQILLQTPGAI